MIILSFSKTTAALKARRKTVTRREWNDEYAERFKRSTEWDGGLVQAWSASPHRKGERVGTIRVLSVTKEPTRLIPATDWEAEGFAYMADNGIDVGKDLSCAELWAEWRADADLETYVVRFEVVEIFGEDAPALLPLHSPHLLRPVVVGGRDADDRIALAPELPERVAVVGDLVVVGLGRGGVLGTGDGGQGRGEEATEDEGRGGDQELAHGRLTMGGAA